jgi:hypothetical protein
MLGIFWMWLSGIVVLSMFPFFHKGRLRGSDQITHLTLVFSIGIGSMLCGTQSRSPRVGP